MKKFKLKIAGCVVLVLAVIIAGKALQPTAIVPSAKPQSAEQKLPKELPTNLQSEPTVQQAVELPKPIQKKTSEQAKPVPSAEKLYQRALASVKEKANPTAGNYILAVDASRKILDHYPDSPEAGKAEELLQDVPEQYIKLYDREMSFLHPKEPKVKKSKRLRRKMVRQRDDIAQIIIPSQ